MVSRQSKHETSEVVAVIKEFFYDMKKTLEWFALAYATVAKWHAEFTQGRSLSDD